jgi:O-antigen/teichoic acid export membrane protein
MSRFTRDAISKPACLLVAGRTIGFAASFIIPVLLVRTFNQAEFGTYKQLFLIYGTLYGLAQFGMAESLYYFVPRKPHEAGPYIANTLISLAVTGLACLGLLWFAEDRIVSWLGNPQLADHVVLLGAFLMLMLVSAAFEIVMVARKRHLTAAWTYGASDVARTILLVTPAFLHGGLRAVLWGGVAFGAVRVVAMVHWLRREYGADLKPSRALWRYQLAYALPFALAVGIEVLQANLHSYVVASKFDAATFAVYAVGCLQIPLVDLITTSFSPNWPSGPTRYMAIRVSIFCVRKSSMNSSKLNLNIMRTSAGGCSGSRSTRTSELHVPLSINSSSGNSIFHRPSRL